MARSRMINRALVSKDNFMQLSCSTQLLYFHLCLNADDDGFVDNAISLMRQLPVNVEDLRTLIEKGFVLIMEEYLYVITHWRMHNRIDRNHYSPTSYLEYMRKLSVDENNVYSLELGKGTNLYDYQVGRGFIEEPEASLKKNET